MSVPLNMFTISVLWGHTLTPSHLHITPSHPLSLVNESMQRIEEDTPMFHPLSSDRTEDKGQTEEPDVSHGVLVLCVCTTNSATYCDHE